MIGAPPFVFETAGIASGGFVVGQRGGHHHPQGDGGPVILFTPRSLLEISWFRGFIPVGLGEGARCPSSQRTDTASSGRRLEIFALQTLLTDRAGSHDLSLYRLRVNNSLIRRQSAWQTENLARVPRRLSPEYPLKMPVCRLSDQWLCTLSLDLSLHSATVIHESRFLSSPPWFCAWNFCVCAL